MIHPMTPPLPETYEALVHHVEARFAETRGRHASSMRCASGCTACCHVHLTLLPGEAARIGAAVEALPETLRRRVGAAAAAFDPAAPVCPLLHDGRCVGYDARPLVCRTQGLPLRLGGVVEVCGLNFTQGPPPADAVTDADALNDQLVAIDFFEGRGARTPRSPQSIVDIAAGAAAVTRRSEAP